MKNENKAKEQPVDELKRLRERIGELETRYMTLTESTGDIIFTLSPEGTVTSLSSSFEVITGWRCEQWVGKSSKSLVHPEDLPISLQVYRRVFSADIPPPCFELRILSKPGDYITMELRVVPQIRDGKVIGYLGIARDITGHKRMEETLRQSEENYCTLIESIPDGIFIAQDEKIRFANEAFARMGEYTVAEMIGKDLQELIAPEDREMVMDRYHRRLAGEDVPAEYEIKALRRNGTRAYVSLNNRLITYCGRAASLGVVRDITEHKNAMEQIQEQAALLDKAHDAIIVLNPEHRLVYWNKGAERLYGWASEEALGKDANTFLYKDGPSSLIEANNSVLEKGEWTGELHQVTKEGREIIVESRWTLMRDSKGNAKSMLIINTDVTERKKIESQLFQVQRMDSIGRLASGIAHDMNNVLTPIMQSLRRLQEKSTDEESRKLLELLERNTKRGAYMVKHVLLFSRGVEGERRIIRVADLISDVEKVARDNLPESIEIRINIPENIWTITGDATQLNQVLMNLCMNARDAMQGGGILGISAENRSIDEDFVRTNVDARTGQYVAIAVSDTGTGIPPEIMDKIFEPFFTTKEPGKGTGIGLTTSLTIVKSHDGFMDVSSEVGKGSVFRVYLPASKAETQGVEMHKYEPSQGGGESILVIDDEAQIRDITRQTLEAAGYRVLTAGNGAEAVSLYSQHRKEIKAVLMDMMMPVMDGPACIWVLRKINPDVRIIAVSGITEDDKFADLTGNVHAFLKKPYTAEKLLGTVRDVISR